MLTSLALTLTLTLLVTAAIVFIASNNDNNSTNLDHGISSGFQDQLCEEDLQNVRDLIGTKVGEISDEDRMESVQNCENCRALKTKIVTIEAPAFLRVADETGPDRL